MTVIRSVSATFDPIFIDLPQETCFNAYANIVNSRFEIYAECSNTQSKEYSNSTTEKEGKGKRSEEETATTATPRQGQETVEQNTRRR